MDKAPIIGQIRFLRDNHVVEGWCWSPDRPDERQVVELFADDRFLAAMVAGRLDPRLLQDGIGDGRHSFALTLPGETGPVQVITARERYSRHVFARFRCGDATEIDPLVARIDILADAVPGLSSRFAEYNSISERAIGLGPHMRELGCRLMAHARAGPSPSPVSKALPLGALRRRLVDQFGSIHLPSFARPKVSVVVHGETIEHTLRTIIGLAPSVDEISAEILVVHDGTDSRLSLLPSLVRNVRSLFDRHAVTPAQACNLGAEHARGALLVFLDTGMALPSAASLAELAGMNAGSKQIIIGGHHVSAMPRLPTADATKRLRGPLELRVCLERSLFITLGQFDTGMEPAGLECVDLCLKAEMSGVAAAIWHEPPRAWSPRIADRLPGRLQAMDAARRLRALTAFRNRWGTGEEIAKIRRSIRLC